MASKPLANAPISRHPLFPTAVALWFAALLGLGSIAIRASVLERIVLALHLDLVIPAASPPLGFTARMLLALVLAGGGGIAGFFMARRMADVSPAGNRLRTAAAPSVIVPSVQTFISDEDEGEDLARLEADRQEPRRRRPLALAEETGPTEMHEFAPLPGGRPTILNIGELDPIPSIGKLPEPEELVAATVIEHIPAAMTAPLEEPVVAVAEPSAGLSEPLPPIESAASPEPAPAPKRQAPPPLAPLPLATSAPVDGSAATRLRQAPLDALGVVELVERFALALEGRRQRASSEQIAALPATTAELPDPSTEPMPERGDRLPEQSTVRPEVPVADQSSRLFDIPAALRTPGLDGTEPNGWTSDWFAKAPVAPAPAPESANKEAPASFAREAESTIGFNGTGHADDELEDGDSVDDAFSSLLDLKPSIRTANTNPNAMGHGSHVPGAIVPSAAFGNSPAETEQALREALAALQRMSGAA